MTRQSRIINAPFTLEQVRALNRYQEQGWFHPFTCPMPTHQREVKLVAKVRGWVCEQYPDCPYVQDWAWRFMADPPPPWAVTST